MTRKLCLCKRCGYQWISNKSPKYCAGPNCHSPYWNKEVVRKTVSKLKKEMGV